MDKQGFKQTFLPLHPRLYRIAYALLENRQDAEDALQELYLKLWNKRGELDQLEHAEAYCTTLMRNLCLDTLRSASHKAGRQAVEKLDIAENSLEEGIDRRDDLRMVRRLIDRLPENQQLVIRLQAVEGYSPDEIETLTGLSAVNIRVLLSRARKTLREQLVKMKRYA